MSEEDTGEEVVFGDEVVRDGVVWYWGMDNQPISLLDWAVLSSSEEKILARTQVGTATVVTAWLGMNDGVPLPEGQAPTRNFGTHVMNSVTEIFSGTRQEALETHERVVEQIRERRVTSI